MGGTGTSWVLHLTPFGFVKKKMRPRDGHCVVWTREHLKPTANRPGIRPGSSEPRHRLLVSALSLPFLFDCARAMSKPNQSRQRILCVLQNILSHTFCYDIVKHKFGSSSSSSTSRGDSGDSGSPSMENMGMERRAVCAARRRRRQRRPAWKTWGWNVKARGRARRMPCWGVGTCVFTVHAIRVETPESRAQRGRM